MQNVRAKNAIGLCIGDKLDHPFDIIIAKGATVGPERKFTDAHIDSFFLCLVFGETHAGQLWICINDTGNGFVVNMSGTYGSPVFASYSTECRVLKVPRELSWPDNRIGIPSRSSDPNASSSA